MKNDFMKYAVSRGLNSMHVEKAMTQMRNGISSPYILEERQLHVQQLDIISRLQMERIIFLGSEINSDTANIIIAQLLYLQSIGDQPVTMMISSPGGEIYSGESIIDTMNYLSIPVHTQCVGLAASMASVILACGDAGHRCALPHSRIMIHQPMGGAPAGTQASDFEINCKQILTLKKELAQMLADASGKDVDEVIKDCDRDFWMRADEALPGKYGEKGLIDSILTKRENK